MARKLVDIFLEGCDRLYQITEQLRAGDDMVDDPNTQAGASAVAAQTAQKIKLLFDQLLHSDDPVRHEVMQELRYLLTALADEILLYQVNWPGSGRWLDNLIEEQLFGTSVAGRAVFQRIRSLGKRYPAEQDRNQLATIYLMALELGFLGECRHQPERLTQYREHLDRLRTVPGLPERAFDTAYRHALSDKKPWVLGAMKTWWYWMLGGVVLYLLVSLVIWVTAMQRFENAYENHIQAHEVSRS